eukprot:172168_1
MSSSAEEELVSFGYTIGTGGTSSGVSLSLHTLTVWFNQNVYQCAVTPSTLSTTYECDASSSLLGCDTTSETRGAKILFENPSGDASHTLGNGFVFITTTGDGTADVTYRIGGLCIIDSAVTTPIIGLAMRNDFMDGQDNLCEDGYTHFSEFCIDNDVAASTKSCAPDRQVLHFDLTQPNVTIDNSLWEDGTSVTISTDSNETCPSETCYDVWNRFSDVEKADSLPMKTDKYTLNNSDVIRCGFVDIGDDLLFIGAMSEYASLSAMQTTLEGCALYHDCPYNEYDLESGETDKLYRWSLSRIKSYRTDAISPSIDAQPYLLITCNMNLSLTRDYMLLPFNEDFVTISFHPGCYQIKEANIRGYECSDDVGNFWNKFHHHFTLDSSHCDCGGCCDWNTGSIHSEDSFGLYTYPNPSFSCAESSTSTTEYWIGSIVAAPTASPSEAPTDSPSKTPSLPPTIAPSNTPSTDPTAAPSLSPIAAPSLSPSATPSLSPTATPSLSPTAAPSLAPSLVPTKPPSAAPTASPSLYPSVAPSLSPSAAPSLVPSSAPSKTPSVPPTIAPSNTPTSPPSAAPSMSPTTCYEGNIFTNDGYEESAEDLILNLKFVHKITDLAKVVAAQYDTQYLNEDISDVFNHDMKHEMRCNATASCVG